MSESLTALDVQRLLENPSAEARADTASKVAKQFAGGRLGQKERAIAEDIFRALVRDAETRVREALSHHVKQAPDLPHDVALALANDVDSVALPMLEFSEVLTDADLVEIIEAFGPAKQTAIARRSTVASDVADALVEAGNEDVVVTLVENTGADISESSLQKVVDKWGDNERVHTPLVHRDRLPISVAERLVSLVSEQLQDHLVAHHELPPNIAEQLALQSRERATIGLVSPHDDGSEVKELVRHLMANGRLTATIILRALCMGDMAFFEESLAALAEVPVPNARILIHDGGQLGLKSIYQKAALPPGLFKAFRIAVDVAHETEYDGAPHDRERFSRRMIERILTQFEDMGSDNLEYLLGRLSKLATPETLPAH